LTSVNSIVTLKGSTIHVSGGPVEGVNNSLKQSGALSLGYVPNTPGTPLSAQILLGREDTDWASGIYIEDTTNKTVIANASIPGGGGIGLYSANGPVTFSSFPSINDVTPVTFMEFSKNTSTIYSTADTISSTTGSLITNGGVYISKTLRSQRQAVGYDYMVITDNQSIVMSSTSGNLALSAVGTITNLNITLPGSASVLDGMTITFLTDTLISNITFGNALVTFGTLNVTNPKTFINISGNTTWWNI
jgi:hypothetical protein